ncbi:GGDEF domain-containing phosphodiesterase [Butyrivibrio sp. AE3006]|uniref:GGDEF domain-containing phosphodiesterase n=1 Tax=Butyrivibrio sp. AE3006 TaxID=1280673 RepID=UPI0003F7DF41|nr:GGDEF domain-containing phosphodiesterase [Butyrivibrio sp. AE3006]
MGYYELLEQLVKKMTAEVLDIEDIYTTLGELCKMFRVSKGVTCFYDSLENEALDIGEKFICYDDGNSSDKTRIARFETDVETVTTCICYFAKGAEPLNKEETQRIDLIQKIIVSIASRTRLQRTVERLSFYDIDGYKNLKFYMREIDRLNEEDKLHGMVAIRINLSHFSLVNQQIGRDAGTVVMRKYISLIEDAIAGDGVVCHIGGDNFIMILTEDKKDDVIKIITGAPVVYDDNSGDYIVVSSSAGVFNIPEEFEYHDFGDIMTKVTGASEQARTGGGASIINYDRKTDIDREYIIKVQSKFVEALRDEEFKVYYQPKIAVETGELMGAEALCRWFRNGRIVPPMEFIPILEMNMDICKLDFYMLEHACMDIRKWLDEGKRVVRVSVNLSRKHMADPDITQHILDIIDRHNVPHEYIEIELTETNADVEFTYLKRMVSDLQEVGIFTSVDDFGMGYSSLNLIKEIPWNVLKVDKCFLPEDDEDERSIRSIMFRHVISLANDMGFESIAEGVETEQQLKFLKETGCVLAQGYFFDKPLPYEEFVERLINYKYKLPY